MRNVKAVILVGGPGTRLQPLTDDTPKSVVPVANRPFMEYTFAWLRQYGITDIVLTLSYLPDVIRDYFGDGSRHGVRLTYCIEEEPLGTAGAVKNAEAFLDGTFFVLNGDVYTDLDLDDMLDSHRRNGAKATISLARVEDPSAFGVVETSGDGRVRRFIEKPPKEEATTNWINAGTYVIEPEVLADIPAKSHYMFEKGLFPGLLEKGEPVYAYPYGGYWLDMGTPEKYFALNRDLLMERTKSPFPLDMDKGGTQRGAGMDVHPSAVITGPVVIGGDTKIGERVSVRGPVVVGPGCRIDNGARIENTILWNDVHIGAGARLGNCIIGGNSAVGPDCEVMDCVVTPSRTAPLAQQL